MQDELIFLPNFCPVCEKEAPSCQLSPDLQSVVSKEGMDCSNCNAHTTHLSAAALPDKKGVCFYWPNHACLCMTVSWNKNFFYRAWNWDPLTLKWLQNLTTCQTFIGLDALLGLHRHELWVHLPKEQEKKVPMQAYFEPSGVTTRLWSCSALL